MGRSHYVGEPTIGGRERVVPQRTTGDAERGPDSQPTVDPNDRAVAQPLPDRPVEEVKEKVDASVKDKVEALSEHSKLKKTYVESDVNPVDPSAESEVEMQSVEDEDLDAQDPLETK